MMPRIKEHNCEASNGTGFPVVMQPVQPGREINPLKCKACGGKGKIIDGD
jgi:DnaJ-class molecular chaperone